MLQVCAVDFTAFHFLLPLMRAAKRDGWRVEFACADGPLIDPVRREGFAYRRIQITRGASPVAQLRATLQLARSLRRDPPDVVHTHTPAGGMVGRAAAMLGFRGKVVHTLHGLPFEQAPRGIREHAFLLAERVVARRTDYFFSQARGDVVRARRLGIVDPRRTSVIGNGVDLDRFAPDDSARAAVRAELGIAADAVVVTFVGRLVREKGILDLADAALALRGRTELRFLIVGESLPSDRTGVGPSLARHPVAKALGRRWRLLGRRRDVERILAATDIFTLPSYREGLPRSIIEAMAVGVPVIASRIPACVELVREGETGLLVRVRDANALAAAIERLAFDPSLRHAMGERAREIAVAEHDERVVVARQLEVLAGVVAR